MYIDWTLTIKINLVFVEYNVAQATSLLAIKLEVHNLGAHTLLNIYLV